jgi:hypothetical protein
MNGFFVGYYLTLLLGPITWTHWGAETDTVFICWGGEFRSLVAALCRDDKMGALAG